MLAVSPSQAAEKDNVCNIVSKTDCDARMLNIGNENTCKYMYIEPGELYHSLLKKHSVHLV